MLKVIVENDQEFEVEVEKKLVNGKQEEWDILKLGATSAHIIKDNKSYRCELLKADHEAKEFIAKINGSIYHLKAKDRFDQLLKKLGMENLGTSKVNDIKAPMPGLVLSINSEKGSEIKKGDPVIILEAMKMENTIKSPGDGTIKSIEVKVGDAVEKNQVLVLFE